VRVGIDLGTTYCCMAWVDDEGQPVVIPSSDGEPTTPSVVWFDGRQAWVGKKANDRKLVSSTNIFEFVKRDMGKPVEIRGLYPADDAQALGTAPYEVDGFRYGAAGIQAIILRKLKKEALRHFKKLGRLAAEIDEKNLDLDAVITVPAYFGDLQRQQTRLAGYAAGLNVVGIINEPTAAALSYGLTRQGEQRVLVFDLGGGTFDVTILHVHDGTAEVVTTAGDNQLGGKDWDELIEAHLYHAFEVRTGRGIPEHRGFEVQQAALAAKLALSEAEETTVFLSMEEGDLELVLNRSAPPGDELGLEMDDGTAFYLEERSWDLLNRCRVICETALAQSQVSTAGGGSRPMEWADLDEIILAGGSCRMPMVRRMLERVSGRAIRSQIDAFNLDTAIAIGAALYGQHRRRVADVLSHSVGVKVKQDSRFRVDHLLPKDTRLPARAARSYRAGISAELEIYEGEETDPELCIRRGRIDLANPEGEVEIALEADADGILTATAEYPPSAREVLEIKNDLYMYDERAMPLRSRIQSLHINL
jgi:molecular chaperone DnaK